MNEERGHQFDVAMVGYDGAEVCKLVALLNPTMNLMTIYSTYIHNPVIPKCYFNVYQSPQKIVYHTFPLQNYS